MNRVHVSSFDVIYIDRHRHTHTVVSGSGLPSHPPTWLKVNFTCVQLHWCKWISCCGHPLLYRHRMRLLIIVTFYCFLFVFRFVVVLCVSLSRLSHTLDHRAPPIPLKLQKVLFSWNACIRLRNANTYSDFSNSFERYVQCSWKAIQMTDMWLCVCDSTDHAYYFVECWSRKRIEAKLHEASERDTHTWGNE